MSKDNIYLGAAAQSRVATRLLDAKLPVFVDIVPNDIDLIARLECGHLVSLQVKLAHSKLYDGSYYSFHSGEYQNVDFYSVVYNLLGEWMIAWVPTEMVEANKHSSLTEDMRTFSYINLPWCKICKKDETN